LLPAKHCIDLGKEGFLGAAVVEASRVGGVQGGL
jgi:hypothetical protein